MVPGQAISPKTPFPAGGLVSRLALATFVNHLNVIAWIPFLPFIAEAHGISVSLLGQIPALMLLLSAFLGLVIGPLADRSGYRRTLFVCLLAVVASSLSTGLAVSLSVLFLAALFGAIGRAAVMPVAQATAASLFMENTARRRAISRIQSGGPLAATLGIPLLTTIAMALHWRGAFIVVSALALGTALILQRMLDLDETASSGEVRLRSILVAYRPVFQASRHRRTEIDGNPPAPPWGPGRSGSPATRAGRIRAPCRRGSINDLARGCSKGAVSDPTLRCVARGTGSAPPRADSKGARRSRPIPVKVIGGPVAPPSRHPS